MKVNTASHPLETMGITTTKQFGWKSNGKAFRAVIDSLYADKEGSICRELATNAFDSHLEAGCIEKPFFVHGPTDLRPEFYVRDFGVGMSDDLVTNVFSTLFDSTKDGSNDQVGGWGLGAKSPFSYTDQFFLSCYDGAAVRHYVCAIGTTGVPELMSAGEEPCDGPRGVKVGFAVDQKDFGEFTSAILRIAQGFDPVFETNLDDVVGFGSSETALAGDGWRAFSDKTRYETGWSVRQGCVIYPLKEQGGLTLPVDHRLKFLIDVPIGSVEVTLSREDVQYTPHTVEALKARIEIVKKQALALVEAEVKDIPSVAAFFRRVGEIKPDFIDDKIIHPSTGLNCVILPLPDAACAFRASRDTTYIVAGRWSYAISGIETASDTTARPIYVVKDVSRFLDHPKEGDPAIKRGVIDNYFTPSERRRMARYTRAYADMAGLHEIDLYIGVDWTDAFWGAVFPNAQIIELSFEEFRSAIPRMNALVAEKAAQTRAGRLDGTTALARGFSKAINEKKLEPLDALPEDGGCWISAVEWRRRPEQILEFAGLFGLREHLYVATVEAQPVVIAGGMLPLAEAAAAKLAPFKLTLAEANQIFYVAANSNNTKFVSILRDLYINHRTQFDRLARSKGLAGIGAKLLPPAFEIELALHDGKPFGLSPRDAIARFTGKEEAAKAMKTCAKLNAWSGVWHNNYTAIRKVTSAIAEATDAKDRKKVVDLILFTQRTFPHKDASS